MPSSGSRMVGTWLVSLPHCCPRAAGISHSTCSTVVHECMDHRVVIRLITYPMHILTTRPCTFWSAADAASTNRAYSPLQGLRRSSNHNGPRCCQNDIQHVCHVLPGFPHAIMWLQNQPLQCYDTDRPQEAGALPKRAYDPQTKPAEHCRGPGVMYCVIWWAAGCSPAGRAKSPLSSCVPTLQRARKLGSWCSSAPLSTVALDLPGALHPPCVGSTTKRGHSATQGERPHAAYNATMLLLCSQP
jgi:hypothetical protein